MKIEFSEAILKKSYKDFKAELAHLFKDQPEDDRENSFKKLYKDATGKDPDQPITPVTRKGKSDETE